MKESFFILNSLEKSQNYYFHVNKDLMNHPDGINEVLELNAGLEATRFRAKIFMTHEMLSENKEQAGMGSPILSGDTIRLENY